MTARYEYEVQGYYDAGTGWECVTTEETRADAVAQLATYDEAEPQYRHRIRRVRA